MNAQAMPLVVEALSLTGAALIAFAYAWFLAAWVSQRVEPRVPLMHPALAGGASAVLTVVMNVISGASAAYVVLAAVTTILILSSWVDSKTKRIPNAYVLHGIALIPVSAALIAFAEGTADNWWTALLWALGLALAAFLVLLGMNIGTRGGMGMGDVKLGAVLAFYLTAIVTSVWTAGQVASVIAPLFMVLIVLTWLTVSFLGGAIWALARGLHKSKQGFPFGPFLALGFVVTVAATPLIGGLVVAI